MYLLLCLSWLIWFTSLFPSSLFSHICLCSPFLMACNKATTMTSFRQNTHQHSPHFPVVRCEYYTQRLMLVYLLLQESLLLNVSHMDTWAPTSLQVHSYKVAHGGGRNPGYNVNDTPHNTWERFHPKSAPWSCPTKRQEDCWAPEPLSRMKLQSITTSEKCPPAMRC